MTMQRDGTNAPAGEDRHTTNRSDEQRRAELEALARALLERESLDGQEILEVTGLLPAPPLENRNAQ